MEVSAFRTPLQLASSSCTSHSRPIIAKTPPTHCQIITITLPKHYQRIANTLPKQCRRIANVLPKTLQTHYQRITKTMPAHCHNAASTLPTHDQHVANTSPKHCRKHNKRIANNKTSSHQFTLGGLGTCCSPFSRL